MSDAPTRIWAVPDGWHRSWTFGHWDLADDGDGNVEYVRADEIERLQAELREARADAYDAYTAGYLDGFKASGEGWNGEFPFEGEDPQEDAHWTERRDEAFAAYFVGLP